jgi:hypothetical protein
MQKINSRAAKKVLTLGVGFLIAIPGHSHAQARAVYSKYEGKEIIKTGEGGSRTTKHGIDYWTSGEPPRKFQLIGTIQDKRDEQMDGGHAVGSPGIAKKVKEAGGDAVIIESEEEQGKGAGAGFGTKLFGLLLSGGSKTVTKMLVIKYISDEGSTNATAAKPSLVDKKP